MKLVQQSKSMMVFKSSRFMGMFAGAFCIILGGFFIYQNFITQGFNGVGFWMPLAFAVLGLLLVLFSKTMTIIIDKAQNKLTIGKKGIIGSNAKEYFLNNIVGIELVEEYQTVETTTSATGGGTLVRSRPKLYEDIVLVMKDGSRLALDSNPAGSGFSVSGVSLGKDREQALAEQIATFVGIPINRVSPNFGNRLFTPSGGGLPPIA